MSAKPLFFLFLVALTVRLAAVTLFNFDGLYGQDPYAYYSYALELRQALAQFQTPPPFFWPIGYPLLVVLGTLVTGLRPLAGQLVSVLAGALIAPLLYLIVYEVRPGAKAGALVAGLSAAVAGQLLLSSTVVMSDAAGLAWLTLSAWAMLRYTRSLRLGWLVFVAFTLGWAVLTRWASALAALPWALSAFLAWRVASRPWRKMIAPAALAALVGGLVVGLALVPGLGRGELSHVGDLQTVGWDPTNAFRSSIVNSDGTSYYRLPIGLFYAQPLAHGAFIFPLLTPFLALGVWALRDRPRSHAALLLGWPLSFFLFLAGIAWQNPRFSLAFFPPLAALVGLGFQSAWDWNREFNLFRGRPFWHRQWLRYWRPILAGWCALALAGSLAWSFDNLRSFTSVNEANITAVQWAAGRVPPRATVITFGLTQTMDYRTDLEVIEIYLQNEETLAALLTGREPVYLYLNLGNVETQWQGKSPQLNLQWLREKATLTELGRHPPFVLYRVDR